MKASAKREKEMAVCFSLTHTLKDLRHKLKTLGIHNVRRSTSEETNRVLTDNDYRQVPILFPILPAKSLLGFQISLRAWEGKGVTTYNRNRRRVVRGGGPMRGGGGGCVGKGEKWSP